MFISNILLWKMCCCNFRKICVTICRNICQIIIMNMIFSILIDTWSHWIRKYCSFIVSICMNLITKWRRIIRLWSCSYRIQKSIVIRRIRDCNRLGTVYALSSKIESCNRIRWNCMHCWNSEKIRWINRRWWNSWK